MSPSTPGWTLNTLTDTLLKKEFDECRAKQIPHRIMTKYNLRDLVPYASEKIKGKNGSDKLLGFSIVLSKKSLIKLKPLKHHLKSPNNSKI